MTWPRRKKAPVPGTASPPKRPAPAPARPGCGATDRGWVCLEAPGHLGGHAVYAGGEAVHRWGAAALPRRRGGVSFAINARECAVTAWNCGRWHVWDSRGQLVFARECKCPRGPHWDEWESELAQ